MTDLEKAFTFFQNATIILGFVWGFFWVNRKLVAPLIRRITRGIKIGLV